MGVTYSNTYVKNRIRILKEAQHTDTMTALEIIDREAWEDGADFDLKFWKLVAIMNLWDESGLIPPFLKQYAKPTIWMWPVPVIAWYMLRHPEWRKDD